MIISPTNTSGAAATDSLYSSTVAVLNLNGLDQSTTITDNSALASDWGVDGTAKLTTSIKKFGTASLNLSGGDGYIFATAASSNFAFASGQNFTVEAWIYPTNNNQGQIIDSRWGGYYYYIFGLNSPGVLIWNWEDENRNFFTLSSGSNAIVANQWSHVAVCRSGNTSRMFVNGVQVTSAADTRAYSGVGGNRPVAGTDGNGPYYAPARYYGYIDSIRITRAARYLAAFTPPTDEFATKA